MKPGQTLISAIQLGHMEKDFIDQLLKKKVTALAYEFIEDKGGGMPVIRVLSEIAGMAAISVAAQYLSSVDSGRGLVLGGVTGVPSTKMVIIGAGTVAENVARIALSMGAEIQIFDNHLYKLRRIKHLLGQQVYTSTIDTTGLAETLKTADVVIGALRAEKGRVRHVVSEEMVRQMKEGALIIDLSIDQGGCIATSEITTHHHPVFRKYGVIHYCVPNISSRVARTATTALSNFFTPTILRASEEGGIEEVIIRQVGYRKGVYTFKGVLTNEAIASKFGLKHKNIELLIAARIG
jgi:alanine dehydrogenase